LTAIYESYLRWFENLELYQKYIKDFPVPFNNAPFDTALLLIIIVICIKNLFDTIMMVNYRKRIRRKRLQEEYSKKGTSTEEDEFEKMMQQFYKFQMMAKMMGYTHMNDVTYEEFKRASQAAASEEYVEGDYQDAEFRDLRSNDENINQTVSNKERKNQTKYKPNIIKRLTSKPFMLEMKTDFNSDIIKQEVTDVDLECFDRIRAEIERQNAEVAESIKKEEARQQLLEKNRADVAASEISITEEINPETVTEQMDPAFEKQKQKAIKLMDKEERKAKRKKKSIFAKSKEKEGDENV